MTGMHALWLPILVSAVLVFVVSALIHMMSPWHKGDYAKMPREDEVRAALRPLAVPPGDYMLPRPSGMADMKSPEFLARMNEGPVWIVTVRPNQMGTMGGMLAMWFVYLLFVAGCAAFIAGRALPPGASADRVRLFTGITSFLGFSMALLQMSIWYYRSMSTTIKSMIDGLIYAAITACTFAWFWPS